MTGSSELTRDLLKAARRDAPDAARRSRIWEAVATAPGVPIAAAGTGAAFAGATGSAGKTFGALSAGKLLLLGALAGSLATGMGFWVVRATMHVEPTRPVVSIVRTEVPAPLSGPVVAALAVAPSGPSDTSTPSTMATAPAAAPAEVPVVPAVHSRASSTAHVGGGSSSEASLMREAALVSEARTLLVSGQAASSLELLDAAARGSSHSLEPETLSLRSRALRALGQDIQADQVEETLRHRFPDHFLAR